LSKSAQLVGGRVTAVAGAFAAGVATAGLGLYAALRLAPGVVMAEDMRDALVVVADSALTGFQSGSVVYVKTAAGPAVLEVLQARHPSLRLKPFSERPQEQDCAGAPAADRTSCARDEFLKLEVLSAPAARSLLIAIATRSRFGQVLLIKFWGRWRILVERSYAL
jgi:3-oxoacyl-[acyl-carrier-protein] synthase III